MNCMPSVHVYVQPTAILAMPLSESTAIDQRQLLPDSFCPQYKLSVIEEQSIIAVPLSPRCGLTEVGLLLWS
jgi:hypothetical protein